MSVIDKPERQDMAKPPTKREERKKARQARQNKLIAEKLQKEALNLLLSDKKIQDSLAGRAERVRVGHKSLLFDREEYCDQPGNSTFSFTGYMGRFDAQVRCEFNEQEKCDIITVTYAQGKGFMCGFSDGIKTVIASWKDHRGVQRIKTT